MADGGGVLYGCMYDGRTRRIHTRSARVRVETSASSVSTYICREILAPGVYSHTTAETTVRRQATGQVVVVVWWWCKIRETARLAANGALLDE